jgi:hypothetical protein
MMKLGQNSFFSCLYFVPRTSVIKASYVPDYSIPKLPLPLLGKKSGAPTPTPASSTASKKNFWEYQAPTADIGSPDGYQLKPVTIPPYGPGATPATEDHSLSLFLYPTIQHLNV